VTECRACKCNYNRGRGGWKTSKDPMPWWPGWSSWPVEQVHWLGYEQGLDCGQHIGRPRPLLEWVWLLNHQYRVSRGRAPSLEVIHMGYRSRQSMWAKHNRLRVVREKWAEPEEGRVGNTKRFRQTLQYDSLVHSVKGCSDVEQVEQRHDLDRLH